MFRWLPVLMALAMVVLAAQSLRTLHQIQARMALLEQQGHETRMVAEQAMDVAMLPLRACQIPIVTPDDELEPLPTTLTGGHSAP
jgi:hypothetical protein